MGYRVIIDEDVDIGLEEELTERGHDAVLATEILGSPTIDEEIAEYAREHDRLVVTHDSHFLEPRLNAGIKVLYGLDHQSRAHELADFIDRWYASVPDSADLTRVSHLSDSSTP